MFSMAAMLIKKFFTKPAEKGTFQNHQVDLEGFVVDLGGLVRI